jgi:hypothetical protein
MISVRTQRIKRQERADSEGKKKEQPSFQKMLLFGMGGARPPA